MEKDLLDISGEDEDYWLLKTTPKKGVTFAGANPGREMSYLDCSPLQIPKLNRMVPARPPFSPIGRVTSNNNKEQAGPSVDSDNVGKENTSGNKVELPKLSVERQQMKKKKKNAGFNLRKSLAWDRAFSTEEGVLDPTELSKITGDLLPAIQEEFTESISASKYSSVSPGLQALEENLFNDLPVNSKHREKKKASGIVSKYASPSKSQSSLAQKKVNSAQDLRSGSKRSGCPRPPPPSSLKRPANVHTRTPHNRELFVSKVSTTKSDPTATANNMKRSIQSPSKAKHSQPIQSKNSQRSLESGSFSRNTSSTKSKTKSSPAIKSSIPKPSLKQARRNVITKTSRTPSVSNSQHSFVGKSNVGPMTTSDVAMVGRASNFSDSSVSTMGPSLTQRIISKFGPTESAVSLLGKPSGLRAPSPSLSYFSQSESQPSHSVGDKPSQIPRSDVCSTSRFSLIPSSKKPQVAAKVPGVNSKSATGKLGNLGSAVGLSAQSVTRKPAQERVKVDFKSPQEVESNVSCSSLSSLIKESVQQPCIIRGDARDLVLEDVAICTSEQISTANCDNVELRFSGCNDNVLDGNMSDDSRDEKRKSGCSVEENCTLPLTHGPIFKDSPVQGPSGGELATFNNASQLKCSNPGEDDICITNHLNGQPLTVCANPGNADVTSPCLSGERDALIHSTENVAEQQEVVDSFTADQAFHGEFPSTKSGVADLSSSSNQLDDTESVSLPSESVEAPVSVQSPCNHLEKNSVSNSILCDHDMACDGQAVLETATLIQVSDIPAINCAADFIAPYPDSKDWIRESEEQHFSCQSVIDAKEGGHGIDVLTRNERADKDDSPNMQIDYFTGSPDVEENMEQVKLPMPSSAEVRMETDQLETPEGCSLANDASGAAQEPEDNSELEDMDLVTDSDCSDEEPDDKLERKEVHLATESELMSDRDEFSVMRILKQEYPEVESIHTAPDQCGKNKSLVSDSISSPAYTVGDPEYLNEDTALSRICEDMSKDDSESGCLEQNFVEKAKSQTDTEKDSGAKVIDQDLSSHEEEEVHLVRISPDPIVSAAIEEEPRTPIHTDEALSVDFIQHNGSNVPSDDTLISEINGDHASDSKSNCTCPSEGKDQKKLLDAKLEKKPDPIIVKPTDAVPFSDEWLAAVEAAGEEILTLKSGRVQHSPTEKTTPELGPWSPVKKKNNQVVGPFDCTKYTNKGVPPTLD